jgi:hypothetical protein
VFTLILSFVLSCLLVTDIVLKFRRGFLLDALRDWGFLSPLHLCFVGGISAYVVGFPGWLLLVVAALVSTSLVQFKNARGERIGMLWFRSFLVRW